MIVPLNKMLGGVMDILYIYGVFSKSPDQQTLTNKIKELHRQRLSLFCEAFFRANYNVDVSQIAPGSYTGLYTINPWGRVWYSMSFTTNISKISSPKQKYWPALNEIDTHNHALPWQ
jgi:hypothetical protein